MGKKTEYDSLILKSGENRDLLTYKDKCDKYDYFVAVGCGVIGGLVDIFLVGSPGDSVLGNWTDKQVDGLVKKFAKAQGWNPKEAQKDNVKSAIGFLERRFKVNYDQSISSSASDVLGITPGNHHMKSLSHSPDILGLFFSLIDQFTASSSFLSDGKLIRMNTETQELYGCNFVSKLFCGIFNWFGHLMSDVAGSSGSTSRGKGIVMPFFELFNLCDFGSFDLGNQSGNRGTLADVATKAFESGYDARFGLAMAIPVLITDLSIRLIWALRRKLQYHYPLKECIPSTSHDDLRVMLLVGNGTLCVLDVVDAGIRSGGNIVAFVTRLNIIAWFKLIKMVLREVFIRIGITTMDMQLEAMKRVADGLAYYLQELKQIDLEAYERETSRYSKFEKEFEKANDPTTLNNLLLEVYNQLEIDYPWEGDFDSFMSDKNNHMVFS